jgi:hypothetical protein
VTTGGRPTTPDGIASAVVETLCASCLQETFHLNRRSGFVCGECGSVTRLIGIRLGHLTTRTGGGGSSEGGSGRGDSPSETTTAYAVPAYAEMLSGEALKALDADPQFARFVCKTAGIEFKQDLPQTIVLGGTEVTIRLWVENNGRYVVRPVIEGERNPTFPGTKTRSLSLGQFYASVLSGRFYRPTGPSLARWKRRALAEWDVIELPPVVLKPLPSDAPTYVELVWAAIELLARVRRLMDSDERVLPLTRSFMPHWCSCDDKTFRRALIWLERNKYVSRAGHEAVKKAKPMTLWRVAEENQERPRAEASHRAVAPPGDQSTVT